MAVDEESPDKNVTKMSYTYNKALVGTAQKLRKQMTDEEKHLWYDFLQKLPQTVYRQKVIGNYVVDFYCAAAKLVIELDGDQHATAKGIEKDAERDKYLQSLGLTVIRYSNYAIKTNFNGVCEYLEEFISKASPLGEAVEHSETDEG